MWQIPYFLDPWDTTIYLAQFGGTTDSSALQIELKKEK